MKKLFAAALLTAVLFACNNDKDQEKQALDKIDVIHNALMAKDDQLALDKQKLDSLAKIPLTDVADTAAEKLKIHQLSGQLGVAEDAMDNWMHKFDPEQQNKPHNEVMKYLEDQKKQIDAIDTQINSAVKAADDYLKQHPQK